jgi:sRNA-binding protein
VLRKFEDSRAVRAIEVYEENEKEEARRKKAEAEKMATEKKDAERREMERLVPEELKQMSEDGLLKELVKIWRTSGYLYDDNRGRPVKDARTRAIGMVLNIRGGQQAM